MEDFEFVSILDDDLYKFTMQQAILKQYPDAVATYKFINRGPQRFTEEFLKSLDESIYHMKFLVLTSYDKNWLKINVPFLAPWYLEFLSTYRYNPAQVKISLTEDNNLSLDISGPWHQTVLWEVKLMALISELYFQDKSIESREQQLKKNKDKAGKLLDSKCYFADFGTRRRRSWEVQKQLIFDFTETFGKNNPMPSYYNFVGTSNVHLAMFFNCKPIGTMAHEWIQAISVLESMNHPNRFMLEKWAEVYDGNLGIALTDTYGTKSFFQDFDTKYSKLFDGVRQDSGDPFVFAEKAVAHYNSKNIDTRSKTIVFSDSLTVDKAIELQNHCDHLGIRCSFGIGTHFTNDFEEPPLNMVIKLTSINGQPVVKLSDDAGKETGDPETIELMKKIHQR